LYLAEKYGGAGPLGADTLEKRAVLARWVRVACACVACV
jgi:hypothetical protein